MHSNKEYVRETVYREVTTTPLLDIITAKRSLLDMCCDAEPQVVTRGRRLVKPLCECGDPGCPLGPEPYYVDE